MTSTTNGTLATRARGLSSIEASLTMIRSRSGGRTTLGAFAFRAFARALAWLVFFGRDGPPVGRGIGLVAGAERCGRWSRAGLRLRGGASAGRRSVLRPVRRGLSAPRAAAGFFAFMINPPPFPVPVAARTRYAD